MWAAYKCGIGKKEAPRRFSGARDPDAGADRDLHQLATLLQGEWEFIQGLTIMCPSDRQCLAKPTRAGTQQACCERLSSFAHRVEPDRRLKGSHKNSGARRAYDVEAHEPRHSSVAGIACRDAARVRRVMRDDDSRPGERLRLDISPIAHMQRDGILGL